MDMIDNPMHNKATPVKSAMVFSGWHENMQAIPPITTVTDARARNVWQMFLGK